MTKKLKMKRYEIPNFNLSNEDIDLIEIPPEVSEEDRIPLSDDEIRRKREDLLKSYIKYAFRKLEDGCRESFEGTVYRLLEYYDDLLICKGICNDHICLMCHDHPTCKTCQRDKKIFSQFGKFIRIKDDK